MLASDMSSEGLHRVPDIEKKGPRVLDLELHDPLDDRDVEIACEHERLSQKLVRVAVLGAYPGLHGPESELLLELALHGHLVESFDERQLQVQTRIGRP